MTEKQRDSEYLRLLRVMIYALDQGEMIPVAEVPIDELELLEIIVPHLLTQLERTDEPIFGKLRTQRIKRNLLAWWNEQEQEQS